MPSGLLAVVLHAHLPFVRHPEHRDHLEERWLFEAIAECYLPLLEALERLEEDQVPGRLVLSLSPPLVAMLRDAVLRERFERHLRKLDALLEHEEKRTLEDPVFGPLVRFYAARQQMLWSLWRRYEGDVVRAFAGFEARGRLELWTCGATHAFLPALHHHPEVVRAQVAQAVRSHEEATGRAPRGFWLPECGYAPGLDRVLRQHGIEYTALESHALEYATPRPARGVLAPVHTAAGLVCFGRDPESSQQVWSAETGYPGDAVYREFYRDVGYDAPAEVVRDFLAADGTRQNTGLKYYRVTQRRAGRKLPYDPALARHRAREHAEDFVRTRIAQAHRAGPGAQGAPPLFFAPYDAELFGHWWFEGPWFLEELFRAAARTEELAVDTPRSYLAAFGPGEMVMPEPSSWGAGGYSGVWLDPGSSWMLRHVDHACREGLRLARASESSPPQSWRGRAVRQLVRELMLLLSSDWAFLIKTGTAPHYARARFEAHLARFRRLATFLDSAAPEPPLEEQQWLSGLEGRDNLWPTLDPRVLTRA